MSVLQVYKCPASPWIPLKATDALEVQECPSSLWMPIQPGSPWIPLTDMNALSVHECPFSLWMPFQSMDTLEGHECPFSPWMALQSMNGPPVHECPFNSWIPFQFMNAFSVHECPSTGPVMGSVLVLTWNEKKSNIFSRLQDSWIPPWNDNNNKPQTHIWLHIDHLLSYKLMKIEHLQLIMIIGVHWQLWQQDLTTELDTTG